MRIKIIIGQRISKGTPSSRIKEISLLNHTLTRKQKPRRAIILNENDGRSYIPSWKYVNLIIWIKILIMWAIMINEFKNVSGTNCPSTSINLGFSWKKQNKNFNRFSLFIYSDESQKLEATQRGPN